MKNVKLNVNIQNLKKLKSMSWKTEKKVSEHYTQGGHYAQWYKRLNKLRLNNVQTL